MIQVMPIRTMKAEEKQDWLQGLWKMLKDDGSSKSRPPPRTDGDGKQVSGRFEEAPGAAPVKLPKPSPQLLDVGGGGAQGGLRRSGAKSVRGPAPARFENLSISADEDRGRAPPSLSPGNPAVRSPSPAMDGEVSIVRMLSTRKGPGRAMLADAMDLALFRVEES